VPVLWNTNGVVIEVLAELPNWFVYNGAERQINVVLSTKASATKGPGYSMTFTKVESYWSLEISSSINNSLLFFAVEVCNLISSDTILKLVVVMQHLLIR
jgi:hypothetical protein